MTDRLIFVSCGQLRAEERRLGQRIKSEIDATPGFKAYFADAVQDLSGLSAHILNALRRSSGAVIALHPRGEVRGDDGRDALHADDRSILAALIAEGGHDIKEQSVRRRLISEHGFEKNQASAVLRTRQTVLSRENLVQPRHNVYDGDEMSLHLYWEWYVRHATGPPSPSGRGA